MFTAISHFYIVCILFCFGTRPKEKKGKKNLRKYTKEENSRGEL